MRAPLAGKGSALRRLAGQARRRLEPVERALPVKLPGFDAGGRAAAAGELQVPAGEPTAGEPTAGKPTAEEAAARIDAARARLRATIEPSPDPET